MKKLVYSNGKTTVVNVSDDFESTSDWLHNYPLRIVAPKALALVYPQIYIWFQINDLPIEKVGDMMYLYCNEIMAEHQGLIDANSEIIKVEHKPIN